MPIVQWSRLERFRWLQTGFMTLWVLVLWGVSHESGRVWLGQLYLFIFPFHLYGTYGGVHVISGGVLTLIRSQRVGYRIPLARAELQRKGNRIQVRWLNGRIGNTESVTTTPDFAAALEAATLAARSATAGSVPGTEAEAAQMISFGRPVIRNRWLPAWVGALIGLLVAAAWMNQPLLLLPLALGPLVAERGFAQGWLMTSGDELWLLRSGMEPHPLPLAGAQVVEAGRRMVLLQTSDPLYPTLRLDKRASAALLRHLNRILRGEKRPSFSVDEALPPEGGHHCSLCGRPLEGRAEASSVQICDPCAARARFEAAESGHGLASKEARPM